MFLKLRTTKNEMLNNKPFINSPVLVYIICKTHKRLSVGYLRSSKG